MSAKNVIICATDVGGARNLAPLLPLFARMNFLVLVLTIETRIDIFAPYEGFIDDFQVWNEYNQEDITNLLRDHCPVVVLVGTTRYPSMDREIIFQAKLEEYYSVVVLDEWYAYHERFADPDSGALKYLPDKICVQDKMARDEAVAAGLPSERCIISGSPSLAELTEKAIIYSNSSPAVPNELCGIADKKIVTFLSETYARDFGASPHKFGLLGPYKGYTEVSVINEIFHLLGQQGEPTLLVEKLHPADESCDSGVVKISNNIEWLRIKNINVWELFWHCDAVIGMQSMGLLEAYILGCKVISYQPGIIGNDTCSAVRLGLVERLEDPKDLAIWLKDNTSKDSMHKVRELPLANPIAKQNVLDIALSEGIYAN